MVKHIILWKLKEEYNTPEIKNNMKTGLEALVGVVPGLLEMKIEIEPLPKSNADVLLYSVLESEEALQNYAVHPAHVKAANELVRPFAENRMCMDFEVE